MNTKITIGRKDKADFLEINLLDISVKIDSGAYSCSIHCESVKELKIDGKIVLEVVFLDSKHPIYSGEKHRFESFSQKKVKSSTGHEELRYFIKLGILLFGKKFKTDFSLTKRNGLRNPVLLGRKLLNENFVIDTNSINLSYRLKNLTKLE